MSIDVFVSYHTQSGSHITLALVNALESRGVRCWYAPRDVFGDYATAIYQAIAEAKVFLLVATEEANLSEDVKNEIELAFDRIRQQEALSIVPFRIDNAQMSAAWKYYLKRQHWIDAIDPPTQEQIDRVVHQVMVHLGREEHMPQVQSVRTKLIENMPAPRKKLEGREAVVEEIHQRLQAGEKLFVCGMGGIGKSQVVKKYALDHKDDYDVRILANFSGTLQETIISDSEIIIQGMERGSAEADVYFARKMKALRQLVTPRTLLVIDNFDVTGDPHLDEILKLPCHVLFTTRTDFSMEGLDVLYLDVIDDAALRQVFLNNYTKRLEPGDEEHIAQLISMLYKHTMAVEIIAKQMLASRKRPAEMVDILQASGIHAMNLRERVRYDEKKSAETTYNIFLTLFSLEQLTAAERSILRDLALVPNCGIDARIFYEWSELDTYEDIDNLIQRNWILRNDDDVISLHPLVAEVVVGEMLKQFPVGSELVEAVMGSKRAKTYGNFTPADLERRASICRRTLEIFPKPDESSEYYHFYLALILMGVAGCEKQARHLLTDLVEIRRNKYSEFHDRNIEIKYHLILDSVISEEERRSQRADFLRIIEHLEGERAYFMAAQCCLKLTQSYYYAQSDKTAPDQIRLMLEYAARAKRNIERMDQDPDPSARIYGLYAATPEEFTGNYHHVMCTLMLYAGQPEAALTHENQAEAILLHSGQYDHLVSAVRKRNLDMLEQSVLGAYSKVYLALGQTEKVLEANCKREEILLRYRNKNHTIFLPVYRNIIACGFVLKDDELCRKYRSKLAELLVVNFAADDPRLRKDVQEYGLQSCMPLTNS